MKNHLYLLLLCGLLLSACAKKTHVADSSTLLYSLKTRSDSSARKASIITDKTITIINRSIDTNIIITGKVLSGYLFPSAKDTSANFENEDLNLFLSIDRTGKATATAIPKRKIVKAKAFEQTTVYNDVVKKEEVDVRVKSDSVVKTNLTAKHTQSETTGSSSFSFALVMVLLIACIFIWAARKFTFGGKLLG